jgi:hypothetical protein
MKYLRILAAAEEFQAVVRAVVALDWIDLEVGADAAGGQRLSSLPGAIAKPE